MATLSSLIYDANFRYLADVSNTLDNNGFVRMSADGQSVVTTTTIDWSVLVNTPVSIDGTFQSLSDVSATIYDTPLLFIRVNAAGDGVEAVALSAAALAGTFVALTDTPATITANQYLKGNGTGNALVFSQIDYNELINKPEVRDPVYVGPRTSGFTANTNIMYGLNSNAASFTVTLPATPAAGDFLGFFDVAGTSLSAPTGLGLNAVTINGNGQTIQGQTSIDLDQENQRLSLIYMNNRWNIIAA